MTHDTALQQLAADLRQHEADTATLGYPRRLMLVDEEAVRAIVRPMSIAESEAKRTGNTGTSEVDPSSSEENGASEHTALPASAPAPFLFATDGCEWTDVGCAECGTPLTPSEAARTDAGKYSLLCRDCTLLALGLL